MFEQYILVKENKVCKLYDKKTKTKEYIWKIYEKIEKNYKKRQKNIIKILREKKTEKRNND